MMGNSLDSIIKYMRVKYEDTGKVRSNWRQSFVNWMKIALDIERDKERKRAQRERFTDASGRPISEATRVMQDAHDNVIANAHLFVDLDEDKPF